MNMNIDELNTYEEIKDFIDSKVLEKQALMESLQEIEQETKKRIDAKEKELSEKQQTKMEALPNKKLFKKIIEECSNLENELAILKKELDSCQEKINLPSNLVSHDEFILIHQKLNEISTLYTNEYRKKELDLLLQVEELNKEETTKKGELENIYIQMKQIYKQSKGEVLPLSILSGKALRTDIFSELMHWMR